MRIDDKLLFQQVAAVGYKNLTATSNYDDAGPCRRNRPSRSVRTGGTLKQITKRPAEFVGHASDVAADRSERCSDTFVFLGRREAKRRTNGSLASRKAAPQVR